MLSIIRDTVEMDFLDTGDSISDGIEKTIQANGFNITYIEQSINQTILDFSFRQKSIPAYNSFVPICRIAIIRVKHTIRVRASLMSPVERFLLILLSLAVCLQAIVVRGFIIHKYFRLFPEFVPIFSVLFAICVEKAFLCYYTRRLKSILSNVAQQKT